MGFASAKVHFDFMNTRQVGDKFKEWQQRAKETAKNVGGTSDRYVRDNTWTAIAVAAVAGCLLGFLLTNRD
jgi:ElaB/YqjD/DUF883 family membrane-anchored ribosome-binding protein